ncbi:mandelate racemase/muconate lactonizing enzyme family protein [Nocardia sp. CDC160]|uniref:mandelate racemase/muconate lactonizing enzyme family protein n=1 Tax=Nocardia sp. CDC160 TaxID=3112166 RepID=UPI002DBDF03C|nr:mandelate racemase/muconate lactonizing enzyme family protein [Nocardia sp. CDC160]MEC3920262.1 mandelate racemase/muconate lactonizing enzyme family protein [Nocardia sp. CDC160]
MSTEFDQLARQHDQDIRVAAIEVVALAAPFADAYGGIDNVPHWLTHPAASHRVLPRLGQYTTLVFVHADDGTIGVGEAYGLPAPEVTATVIDRIIAPLLLGTDAMSSVSAWETMYQAQAALGHNRGFYMEALSGVDLALWDLRGKALGMPVYRLLGGPIRRSVECYASPVPLLDEPAESARRAVEFAAQGFRAIKLKLGRGVGIDLAHVAAVVEAVGEGVEVLVDANCSYHLDAATRLGRGLAELGVSWLEEPLTVDDLDSLAELRHRTGLTIVNGETHFTRYDVRDSLTWGAIDVVMPNLTRCGGLTEALRIAALAGTFHVDVSPHGVGSAVAMHAALHYLASVPNARRYEYNQLPNALRHQLVQQAPLYESGRLSVPDGPGLGFELDPEVVDRYTVNRSRWPRA